MKYAKAIVAILVAVAGALVTALGTSPQQTLSGLDTKTWLVAALAVLGSGGVVWFAANTAAAPVIKTVLAGLTAGIGSLVVALDDNHINQAEWLTAFSAAALATGLVYQVANKEA